MLSGNKTIKNQMHQQPLSHFSACFHQAHLQSSKVSILYYS